MFSFASSLRKSSVESLFSCAIRAIAFSICVSSTRTPLSLANCSKERSVNMRSRTCLSRMSCAGGCTFCCLSCCKTIRLASSRSYWVIASSLTTATTRSTLTTRFCGGALGCASAQADASANPALKKCRNTMGDLLELWKIIARRGARGPQGRIGDGQIAGDAAPEDIDRVGAEARESVQLELHEHGLAGKLRRRRQPLTDDAKRPAPAIVLEPHYALQGFAVDE